MPSVIIPAHNEEALVADCLRSLVDQGIDDLEIIVVANACTDRTADVVLSFSSAVLLLETETPGKTNALNLGERHAKSFPRLFLDSDIVLRAGCLRSLFDALHGGVHIASPMPEFISDHANLGVRLFYASLRANKYFGRGAPNGSGAFAVTSKGRSRWGEFPEIIADDGFVELQFAEYEACTVPEAGALVRTPKTFRVLLDIKTRARLGRFELRAKYPDLAARGTPTLTRTLLNMIADPRLWLAIPVYAYVRLHERRAARCIAQEKGFTGWLRDETSRVGASAAQSRGSAP